MHNLPREICPCLGTVVEDHTNNQADTFHTTGAYCRAKADHNFFSPRSGSFFKSKFDFIALTELEIFMLNTVMKLEQ